MKLRFLILHFGVNSADIIHGFANIALAKGFDAYAQIGNVCVNGRNRLQQIVFGQINARVGFELSFADQFTKGENTFG